MKKVKILIFTAILSAIFMCEKSNAFENYQMLNNAQIYINGKAIDMDEDVITLNGHILVPIRKVSESLGANVEWNDEEKKLTIITKNRDVLEMKINNTAVTINGEDYKTDIALLVKDNKIYLPVRLIGQINHATVNYSNENVYIQQVSLHIVKKGEDIVDVSKEYDISTEDLIVRNGLADDKILKGQQLKVIIPYPMNQNNERLYILSKIIEAEAQGESMEGKIAVGDVIMNRVNSSKFPNTIKEVVYQKNQFTPVKTGKIEWIKPSEASKTAAQKVLNGENVVKDALYFYNPRLTTSTFFNKLTFIKDIGNHRFLK